MKSIFNKKSILFLGLIIIIAILITVYFKNSKNNVISQDSIQNEEANLNENTHPLSIENMRNQDYPGSDITIEEELPSGSNYNRYIASYKSDGLKIYALFTIPMGEKPIGGWPAIIFNHGYIPPAEYKTTEKYIAYTDAFSKNGYIVFRSDYRGHGKSEGNPEGAYYSPSYTRDVLNAFYSIKKYKDVNPEKIGMWGHSMGGSITLRSMVIKPNEIKAGVIWAGVVASYQDMMENWSRSRPFVPSQREQAFRRPNRQMMVDAYGSFEQNPQFWNSIAPIYFVKDILSPIQIHHGTNDDDVPYVFSQKLDTALKKENKQSELYLYEGDDHNISQNLSSALQRSVDFFDKNLK